MTTDSPPARQLGTSGPLVSALGYGAMGLSGVYGSADDTASADLVRHALDLGVNHIDTADVYGDGHNERLIGRAIAGRRDSVVLATKFGAALPEGAGRPEYVRRSLDASLRRLGADHVDIYYLHRTDPSTLVEETVGAMGEQVRAGKVRYLGLSEVRPATVRAAHAVHPIAAVQNEYSLFTRDVEAELLPVMRELGVGLVPYSPLGRGILTGAFRRASDLPRGDPRGDRYPRFGGDNLDRNQALIDELRGMADELHVTPSQLALAWVLAQGDDVAPVFGTRHRANLESNLVTVRVDLDAATVRRLDEMFPPGAAVGERYNEALLRRING